ncbi:hypothetical protein BpHYR1_046185 [Brachionus plicatilis]|uniref:UPAR/Ly6 domain-containing protein n=1 Tax=Brachionus plicatilis TaxID=10195 RepID=A0A3M7RY46_BRAPC|nr:hypothetical protein BpHYR1_046185 [Brachionus plicatilis]
MLKQSFKSIHSVLFFFLVLIIVGIIGVDALKCYKCDNCPGSTANKTNAPELITCPEDNYFCLRQELKTKINSKTVVRTIYMNCARICIGGFVSNVSILNVNNEIYKSEKSTSDKYKKIFMRKIHETYLNDNFVTIILISKIGIKPNYLKPLEFLIWLYGFKTDTTINKN